MPFVYEDKIEEINKVINSKRGSWNLEVVSYMDFEDVAQIIRNHISQKFDLWDQTRPIENWVSVTASNQIRNLLRNHYYRVAPPCLGCKMNLDNNDCSYTPSGKKCSECPLYKKWARSKKNAYQLKMASSLDESPLGHATKDFDIAASAQEFHTVMLSLLDPKAKTMYKLLYIDCLTEDEVAVAMGFKTNEKRRPGYKQICNIKKKILETAQHVINNYDVIK